MNRWRQVLRIVVAGFLLALAGFTQGRINRQRADLVDGHFLRAEGVTDFARYRCDPNVAPPRVGFDFKAHAG